MLIARPGKRVGLGRVMGQNGFGSKRVWVKMGTGQNGSIKKGCFGSGRNGFGSERVLGQNGFRVRTGIGSG
ncbi:hypothetical protein Hanom_Chr13g01210821 [Helianthus anomalus]